MTGFLKHTPKDKQSNTHTPLVVPALVSLLGGPDKSNKLTGKQAVKSGHTDLRKALTALSLAQSEPPPSGRRSSLLRMFGRVRPEVNVSPSSSQTAPVWRSRRAAFKCKLIHQIICDRLAFAEDGGGADVVRRHCKCPESLFKMQLKLQLMN